MGREETAHNKKLIEKKDPPPPPNVSITNGQAKTRSTP